MSLGRRTYSVPINAVHSSTAGDPPVKRKYLRMLAQKDEQIEDLGLKLDGALLLIQRQQHELENVRGADMVRRKELEFQESKHRVNYCAIVTELNSEHEKVQNLEKENAEMAEKLAKYRAALLKITLEQAILRTGQAGKIICTLQEAGLAGELQELANYFAKK